MKLVKTLRSESHLSRDDEVLYRVERLKEASIADERDCQKCIEWLQKSQDNVADALRTIALDATLCAHRIDREEKGKHSDLEHWIAVACSAVACDVSDSKPRLVPQKLAFPEQELRQGRLVWWPLAAGVIAVAIALVIVLSRLYEKTPLVPMAMGERVELPDRSVVTTDPETSGRVNYTLLKRDVDLLAGGADFEVDEGWRPFHVNTPLGTATAIGTRFYVRLVGSAESLQALVAVRLGKVSFLSRANSPQPLTLAANQVARFTSDGRSEVTDLSVVALPTSVLAEFTDEPLAWVAARVNLRGHEPRIVVEGKACWHLISGSIDLDDPASLIDHVDTVSSLAANAEKGVVFIRDAVDSSPARGVGQNGCELGLNDYPAALPARGRP